MPDMETSDILKQAAESFQIEQNDWNDDLERYISHIARTGDTLVSWEKARRIFMKKLELALDDFYNTNPYSPGKVNANAINDDFDEMKQRLLDLAEDFDGPPFTIQRLCELLTNPKKNYKKCEKFMRGLEKNLMVVTSWNYPPRRASQGNDSMVNGISFAPNSGIPPSDRVQPHWANLPPSPIATAPPKIIGAPDFTAVNPPKEDIQPEENTEGAAENESQSTEDVPKEETEDQKPNISATIISSSPPTTISIKRKIDESSDEDNETKPIVPESPTKKLKFDEVDGSLTPTPKDLGEEMNDDSTNKEHSDSESKPEESIENPTCETVVFGFEQQPSSPSKEGEGTSVDPTPEEDMKMEVD